MAGKPHSRRLTLFNYKLAYGCAAFQPHYAKQCYYADLFPWGMRLHTDRDFVKDCIQEVFMNLRKIQESINSVDNVRSYLLVVHKTHILRELANKHHSSKSILSDDYSFSVEFAADAELNINKVNVQQMISRQEPNLLDTCIW